MTSTELARTRVVIELQKRAISYDAWRSCINCDFWRGDKNLCAKWEATPPAETIVLSCEEWMYKIPF